MEGIFLSSDWWKMTQAVGDGAIPGVVGNAGWTSPGKQASKQLSRCFLHQLLLLGSCCLWAPGLLVFSDKLLYGTVSEISPYLPKLLLVMGFITLIVTLRHFDPVFLIKWRHNVSLSFGSGWFLKQKDAYCINPCSQITDKCDFRKEGLLVRWYVACLSHSSKE